MEMTGLASQLTIYPASDIPPCSPVSSHKYHHNTLLIREKYQNIYPISSTSQYNLCWLNKQHDLGNSISKAYRLCFQVCLHQELGSESCCLPQQSATSL